MTKGDYVKTYEKELLNELKALPAFQKIKVKEKESLIDALFSFLKSLLPEEKLVIQILYNSPNPLSVKQIRKKYAIFMAIKSFELTLKLSWIKSKYQQRFGKKLLPSGNNLGKFIQMAFLEPSIRNFFETFKEKEIESLISFLNKNLPEKIPSYYKLKGILEYLESIGVVNKRELTGRKAETVWFLSPIFSKICSSIISFIERENNKRPITSIEKEVYFLITGRFPQKTIKIEDILKPKKSGD